MDSNICQIPVRICLFLISITGTTQSVAGYVRTTLCTIPVLYKPTPKFYKNSLLLLIDRETLLLKNHCTFGLGFVPELVAKLS